jgi:biopolymer transport protein ExbD
MRLAAAALCLAALALGGCDDDERKPYPFISILVRADGLYTIDGRTYDRPSLDREISRLGESLRRPITNDARAYITLRSEAGTSPATVMSVTNTLQRAGFNNIQTAGN